MSDGHERVRGVSAAQVARVRRMRGRRETNEAHAAAVALVAVIAIAFLLIFIIASAGLPGLAAMCIGVGVTIGGGLLAGYRHTIRLFDGRWVDGRIECALTERDRLPLRYRFALLDKKLATLHIDRPLAEGLVVTRGAASILDPTFDGACGADGSPHAVALIGPALRDLVIGPLADYAPRFDARGVRLTIGDRPLPSVAILTRLAFAVDALGHRLADPPTALARMAVYLDAPFDAARALAVLFEQWPALAVRTAESLQQTPRGAALARAAETGLGLDDPALSPADRARIGRGVLGVPGSARVRLLASIATLPAQTPADAMAMIELSEAAGIDTSLVQRHLDLIEAEGGPECLAWLQQRARRGRADRKRLERFNARIAVAFSGQLSVEASESAGALSDPRVGEVALDDDMPEAPLNVLPRRVRLTPEQQTALDRARRPTGRLGSTVVWRWNLGAAVPVLAIFALGWPPWLVPIWAIGFSAVMYSRPTVRRELGLQRKGRIDVVLSSVEDGFGVLHRRATSKENQEWILLRPTEPFAVELTTGRAGLLDPAFDTHLGLAASDRRRALLGPVLRGCAPTWSDLCGFRIVRGRAELRIGKHGIEPNTLLFARITDAVVAYADRLAAPPVEALTAMARELDHPFDAARALAALGRDWRGPPERVAAEIASSPLGAAIGRMALTGEGLLDDAVSWAQRIEIARGVLGVSGRACDRLVQAIIEVDVADDATAMAVVELAEAAQASACLAALERCRSRALRHLRDVGGAECLSWLRARGQDDAEAAALADAVRGRLLTRGRAPAARPGP